MDVLRNPYRGGGKFVADMPFPSVAAQRVADLLVHCPAAAETPLVDVTGLSPIEALWIKDERQRMNLGSFKALGAAYVIARHAQDIAQQTGASLEDQPLAVRTYVTASAGNHGLSVAAGARVFGARAVVYIGAGVPESFAQRLRAQGADVVREGADYAASMSAAAQAAQDNGWTLLSDSSWAGYSELPYILMEGYVHMAAEAVAQCPDVPTHIFLQAGVGGLAGAVAAYARHAWGDAPQIIVVEPEAAPAIFQSIAQGAVVFADGPQSIMGRLDCKEPSLIALNGLARDADICVTLSDETVAGHLPAMAAHGIATSASGGAGVAAVLDDELRAQLCIDADARVLCIVSEGPDTEAAA